MMNLSIPRADVHEESCVRGLVNLYVATAFRNAAEARKVHARVARWGVTPVSSWAVNAHGPEDLSALSRKSVQALAHLNDHDLLSAHLVLVIAREGEGGEVFAETRLALAHRIPVLWTGERRILSAYREGVLRVARIDDALDHVKALVKLVGHMNAFEKNRAREMIWGFFESEQDAGKSSGVAEGSSAA